MLLAVRAPGRTPAFEAFEGVGCAAGLLDGPVALASALVATGGPAAGPGQAVTRTNVANMAVHRSQLCFENVHLSLWA